MNKLMLCASALSLTAACATTPETFERRTRKFDVGEYQARPEPEAHGSLFQSGRNLFDDERARAVGDVVVVHIQEADSAEYDSSNSLSREASVDVGIDGAVNRAIPQVGMSDLLGYSQSSSLQGKGQMRQGRKIKAMLPVRVQRILPNGDLYVEGTKIVQIGREKRDLYVSGVVRVADLQPDGSVLSSRLADADITYQTEGPATDQGQQGWLGRFANWIWPF